MEKEIMTFELASKQLKYKDIFNKDFLELEFYAISDIDPNRNKTHFTLESMKKALNTFVNKPILGFFKNGDFEEHNGNVGYDMEEGREYWDTEKGERILGLIRESDPIEIVEKDGLNWIRFRCAIWVQYCYKQVRKILKDRSKKVSVEIMVHDKIVREDGVEDILDFSLRGVTILGSKNGKPVCEGIQGAHLSLIDDFENENYQNQKNVLSFAYKQIDEYSVKSKNIDASFNAVKEVEVMEENQSEVMVEEEYAKEYSITVDKSKEAMSDRDWGSIDKTALRKKVVEASNFKTIADDIFLDLREGWEDGEVTKLKYPVMEINDDVAVYNREALGTAKAYAEKNNETEVLSKLNKIYEALDLDDDMSYSCEDYCDIYEDEPCPCDDEVENTPANVTEAQEDFNSDDSNATVEEDDSTEKGPSKEEYESLYAKYNEVLAEYEGYKAQIEEIQENNNTACQNYKAEIEALNSKISEYEEKQKLFADYDSIKDRMIKAEEKVWKNFCKELEMKACQMMENEKIDKEDAEAIKEKCQKGEYASEEDIKRDVAYAIYSARPVQKVNRYATGINVEEQPVEKKNKNTMSREERIAARCGK